MTDQDAVQAQTCQDPFETQSNWPEKARNAVVRRGIKLVCGSADFVPTSAASDVSLVSAGLRFLGLKILRGIGVRNFIARSGLGYEFLCHVGDLSEYPFYHRRAYEKELALCCGWLKHEDSSPVIYDVGANTGFISTHLAQMLASQSPQIYAFEPVPTTFEKLQASVTRLGVQGTVYPVALALNDIPGSLRIAVSKRNSLISRVIPDQAAPFLDDEQIVCTRGTTLDHFGAEKGVQPTLIKMDIEGSEVAALCGARDLLSREDRPGIAFSPRNTMNPFVVTTTSPARSVGSLRKGPSGPSPPLAASIAAMTSCGDGASGPRLSTSTGGRR
jgi:FkbM family methyltransferase